MAKLSFIRLFYVLSAFKQKYQMVSFVWRNSRGGRVVLIISCDLLRFISFFWGNNFFSVVVKSSAGDVIFDFFSFQLWNVVLFVETRVLSAFYEQILCKRLGFFHVTADFFSIRFKEKTQNGREK